MTIEEKLKQLHDLLFELVEKIDQFECHNFPPDIVTHWKQEMLKILEELIKS